MVSSISEFGRAKECLVYSNFVFVIIHPRLAAPHDDELNARHYALRYRTRLLRVPLSLILHSAFQVLCHQRWVQLLTG